jgi:DNA (cytosine-5)-methyltransferase 1
VLDSRYFGVPQRRRRVFIVGRRTAGQGAQQVLLEPESGGGNFAPSRQAGARAAASLSRGSAGPGVSAPGRRQEDDENIVSTLQNQGNGRSYRIDAEGAAGGRLIAHTLRAEGFDASEDGAGRGTPIISTSVGTLTKRYGKGVNRTADDALVCASADSDGMRTTPSVPRRTHDLEDPPPDGPRYAAMGNAVTVSVAEWIGRRIVTWEAARQEKAT